MLLPGAGLAGNRDKFPGTGVNGDIVENQRTVRVVAEGDAIEQNVAAQMFDRLPFDFRFRNCGEQRAHLIERRQHGGNGAAGFAEPGR